MGRDKALIKVAGVPLLRRICEAALYCTPAVYVVSARVDRYRSVLPSSCLLVPEFDLQGPLVGFAQALKLTQTDWVMLLACDLPRLRGEHLQPWTNELAEAPPTTIALLPKGAKGWEPLCGFYRRRCLDDLQSFIDRGGRSFQRWLAEQSVQELLLDDQSVLFNCNTPDDLEKI